MFKFRRIFCIALVALLLFGMVGCSAAKQKPSELATTNWGQWYSILAAIILGFSSLFWCFFGWACDDGVIEGNAKRAAITWIILLVIILGISALIGKNYEKDKKERYEALTVCDLNGHEYVTEKIYEVPIKTYDLMEGLNAESYYEGNLHGSMSGGGLALGYIGYGEVSSQVDGKLTITEVYRVLCKVSERGYVEKKFPRDENFTQLVPLQEGETSHVEIFTRYTNWKKCSVCGKETWDKKEEVYYIYLPQEIIGMLLTMSN